MNKLPTLKLSAINDKQLEMT